MNLVILLIIMHIFMKCIAKFLIFLCFFIEFLMISICFLRILVIILLLAVIPAIGIGFMLHYTQIVRIIDVANMVQAIISSNAVIKVYV